jgi:hypothetical protein
LYAFKLYAENSARLSQTNVFANAVTGKESGGILVPSTAAGNVWADCQESGGIPAIGGLQREPA